jgi:hypothetical protein
MVGKQHATCISPSQPPRCAGAQDRRGHGMGDRVEEQMDNFSYDDMSVSGDEATDEKQDADGQVQDDDAHSDINSDITRTYRPRTSSERRRV